MANCKPQPEPAEDPQYRIPFDAPPDWAVALRLVNPAVVGLSKLRWMQVRELAAAVILCGVHDGCRASVSKLITVMNQNRIKTICGSRAAFFRIRLAAVACGVLLDEPEYDGDGRTFSERSIDLRRVRELVELSGRLASSRRKAAASLKARKMRLTCDSPETHPLLYSNHSNLENSGRLTTGRPEISIDETRGPASVAPASPRVPSVAAGELDLEAVRRTVAKILDATRRAPSSRDWQSCVKWAILAAPDRLGERWLLDALGAVVHATKPIQNRWAYLTDCLKENTAKAGRRYGREMARVTIPAELREFSRPERVGRSCVALAADQALFS